MTERVNVQMDKETLARVVKIAAKLSKATGVTYNKADAIRWAITQVKA